MEIEISAQPLFRVPLTLADVAVLLELSALHYDETCRLAGVPGEQGFIYGWNSWLTLLATTPDEPPVVTATWRQLDLCLKLMEFLPYRFTAERTATVRRLSTAFNGAMSLAQAEMSKWAAVYVAMESS